MKKISFYFIFGFIATIVFHQASLYLLFLAGQIPAMPWDFSPVAPLGTPKVISLSFFGGLWGIPLGVILEKLHGAKYWIAATVLGAIFPTAVAMLVVFPLKGITVVMKMVIIGLIVNAAWGIGVAVQKKIILK